MIVGNYYPYLKPRYVALFSGIALIGLALSLYPTWQMAAWLADVLNISPNDSVSDHENAWLWFTGSLLIAIANLLLCICIGSILISWLNGWSKEQALDYLVRGRFPEHWYKSADDLNMLVRNYCESKPSKELKEADIHIRYGKYKSARDIFMAELPRNPTNKDLRKIVALLQEKEG